MKCRLCRADLSQAKRVWCSRACYVFYRRKLPTHKIRCRTCGRTTKVPLESRRRQNRFCSQTCAAIHYNRRHRGLKNPNWRGGTAMNYGAGWKAIKRQVRERDHLCQGCGKTPKENGRALDVHHIQPFRYSADNSLDNLMALCRSCHMRANDHGRRGHARFAGPEQILKPLSNADLKKIRAKEERSRRWQWHERAFALHDRGKSLRQIACELNVSHQTIANWLSARHELRASVN